MSRESNEIRKAIWNFKDGINQARWAEITVHEINEHFDDLSQLVFVCIPASTVWSNCVRYGNFSETICRETGMQNGFHYIHITKEKEPGHLGGKDKSEFEINADFFRGKQVILFDDVVTSCRSMEEWIERMRTFGADVVACVSLGRTYHSSSGYNPVHPFSQTTVRDGNKIENTVATILNVAPKLPAFKVSGQTHTDAESSPAMMPIPLPNDIKVGDYLRFGHYNNRPLQWQVLSIDGNNIQLITKFGIVCRSYHDQKVLCTWAESDLRHWLVGEFYDDSFSLSEKAHILRTKVRAEVVDHHELYPGVDTYDQVRILSVSEYNRYFNKLPFKCKLFSGQPRQCWLRNYGADRTRAAFVGRSGTIHYGGSDIQKPRNAVRPVIWISR